MLPFMAYAPLDFFAGWVPDPGSAAALLVIAVPYVWGWMRLRRKRSPLATVGRLLKFAAGLCALAVAFTPPLVTLQQELLTGRAAQHVLVGLLAPPLIWLACPVHAIVLCLPVSVRNRIVRIMKASTDSGRFIRKVTHPIIVWMFVFSMFLLWHEPVIANWLLARPSLYRLSLWGVWITYMLFWWHPLRTGPRLRPAMSPVVSFLYIIVGGEVPNMVTGVTLAFRKTPAYAYYAGRLDYSGLTTMQDQMISGGVIWFVGSIVYVSIAVALLGRVFRNFEPPPPPPISWEATERTIAPGLEHRILGQRMK